MELEEGLDKDIGYQKYSILPNGELTWWTVPDEKYQNLSFKSFASKPGDLSSDMMNSSDIFFPLSSSSVSSSSSFSSSSTSSSSSKSFLPQMMMASSMNEIDVDAAEAESIDNSLGEANKVEVEARAKAKERGNDRRGEVEDNNKDNYNKMMKKKNDHLQSVLYLPRKELKYESFFADYGPINLGRMTKFTRTVHQLANWMDTKSMNTTAAGTSASTGAKHDDDRRGERNDHGGSGCSSAFHTNIHQAGQGIEGKKWKDKRMIHIVTSDKDEVKSNTVFLLCAYLIVFKKFSPQQAYFPFLHYQSITSSSSSSSSSPSSSLRLPHFRDAAHDISTFPLTLWDVLKGLSKAINCGHYHEPTFNVEEYMTMNELAGGDINWIIPGRFLAFSGPFDVKRKLVIPVLPDNNSRDNSSDRNDNSNNSDNCDNNDNKNNKNSNNTTTTTTNDKESSLKSSMEGGNKKKSSSQAGTNQSQKIVYTLNATEYAAKFKGMNVAAVVRFNEPTCYNKKAFTSVGIRHVDLYYEDGSNAPPTILKSFLTLCNEVFQNLGDESNSTLSTVQLSRHKPGAIAVHCKAGLGRTGTNIAVYMMQYYGYTAREAISWLRICRPGCILGPQQAYLCSLEPDLLTTYYMNINNMSKTSFRFSPSSYPSLSFDKEASIVIKSTHREQMEEQKRKKYHPSTGNSSLGSFSLLNDKETTVASGEYEIPFLAVNFGLSIPADRIFKTIYTNNSNNYSYSDNSSSSNSSSSNHNNLHQNTAGSPKNYEKSQKKLHSNSSINNINNRIKSIHSKTSNKVARPTSSSSSSSSFSHDKLKMKRNADLNNSTGNQCRKINNNGTKFHNKRNKNNTSNGFL